MGLYIEYSKFPRCKGGALTHTVLHKAVVVRRMSFKQIGSPAV